MLHIVSKGVHCEKKNPWVGEEARRVDKAFYQLVGQVTVVGKGGAGHGLQVEELGEGVELLWRVEGEEVELVVSAPTTSWVGLGWRPLSSTKACQVRSQPPTCSIMFFIPFFLSAEVPRPPLHPPGPGLQRDGLHGHGEGGVPRDLLGGGERQVGPL